jgi:hypothetical protein
MTLKELKAACAASMYAKEIAFKFSLTMYEVRKAMWKHGLKRYKRPEAELKQKSMDRYYDGLKREYPDCTIRGAQKLRRERRVWKTI